jgi:hypothetical protein
MASDARVDARMRLETALVEEDRLGELYEAARGTSSELGVHVRLRAASDEVAARQAWLTATDDDGVGGRVWINGREVGGPDTIFQGLEDSHD